MKSYYIESLGCAKNLVDSEIFASILQRAGYQVTTEPEEADIVLVNTCSFLHDSLRELDFVLAELAELKEENQSGQLLVTGCVMNRGLKEFQDAYPEVDAWIGLKDFSALENRLHLEPAKLHTRVAVGAGYHRYLRISDGCNNHCSYCTIPSIRGDLQSVPIEVLVQEARDLAKDAENPALELIVIAQDTSNYGMDIYGRKALPELLEQLHAIPEYQWIRVMYLHPDHFELDWLALWKRLPKLLPYFEIPIQHSEDHILKAMNRHKGRAELTHLFQTIRKELPKAVLRTTLISGFPGETRQDALALQSFIRETPFLYLGVFVFSPEEGTPADEMDKPVFTRTARNRRDRLFAIQNERSVQMLESYVGKTIQVLVEAPAGADGEDGWEGRAWFQAPEIDGITYLDKADLKPGRIYSVLITDVIDMDLFGQVIS